MTLILLYISFASILGDTMDFNFGYTDNTDDWTVVNDNVMGGISRGKLEFTENTALFSGKLSLENNGGFASIRSPYGEYDIAEYESIEIKCRGYGGEFDVVLTDQQPYYLPRYKGKFIPKEEWQIFKWPLRELKGYRLGQATGQTISDEILRQIIRFGVIKSDKNTSAFELEIDYIRIY